MADLGNRGRNKQYKVATEICGKRIDIPCCEAKSDYAFYVMIFDDLDLQAAVGGYQNSPLFNVTKTPEGFWRIASNGWDSGVTFNMALNYFNSSLSRTNGHSGKQFYVLNMLTPKQYEDEEIRRIALQPRVYEY